MNPIEAGRA